MPPYRKSAKPLLSDTAFSGIPSNTSVHKLKTLAAALGARKAAPELIRSGTPADTGLLMFPYWWPARATPLVRLLIPSLDTLSGHSAQSPAQPWDPIRLVTVSAAPRGRQQGKERVFQTLLCLLLRLHITPGEREAAGADVIGYQRAPQARVRSSNSSSGRSS